jgi:hypothetical protein
MKLGLHFYSSFILIFIIYCFTCFLFEEVFSIENFYIKGAPKSCIYTLKNIIKIVIFCRCHILIPVCYWQNMFLSFFS